MSTIIRRVYGDLFKHTAKTGKPVLAHATNLRGIWGAGVAKEFKERFPLASLKHEEYVKGVPAVKLIGTAQVIQTEPQDPGNKNNKQPAVVVCLFLGDISNQYAENDIVNYTGLALADLKEKLKDVDGLETEDGKVVLLLPKINAGIFRVPWARTEKVLEKNPQFVYNVYLLDKGWPEVTGPEDPNLVDQLKVD